MYKIVMISKVSVDRIIDVISELDLMNTMVIENAIEKALIYERCGVSKIYL